MRVSRCLVLLLSMAFGGFAIVGCSETNQASNDAVELAPPDWQRFAEIEAQIKAADSADAEAEAFDEMARWVRDESTIPPKIGFYLSCEDESGNAVSMTNVVASKRTDLILTIGVYPRSDRKASRILHHKVFDPENIGILMLTE